MAKKVGETIKKAKKKKKKTLPPRKIGPLNFPLNFMAGLPRSGSTLLQNMLGQNPNHFVTPTSGVVDILMGIQKLWVGNHTFNTWGPENVKPHIRGGMAGWLYGFYRESFERGMIVFDKSRAWPTYIEDLEKILERKVKVVVMIRDVRSILASFEKLYRKRDIDHTYPQIGEGYYQAQTIEGRCEHLLEPHGVVGGPINRVMDALARCKDRLHVISYGAFCEDPKGELKKLHKALDLPPFNFYNPNKVEQLTKEDDTFQGADLHTIRPKVKAFDPDWEKIIPKRYASEVLEKYFDLEVLAQAHKKE